MTSAFRRAARHPSAPAAPTRAPRRRRGPLPGRIAAAFVLVAFLASACATPVGISRVKVAEAHRDLTRSAVATESPSEPSRQVLRRLGLGERFRDDPAAVLAILHRGLAPAGDDDRLFALAELSFLYAQRGGDRSYYLASAVYAYALLFPGNGAEAAFPPSDPRLLLTYELYNLGLAEALRVEGREELDTSPGARALPFGSLAMSVDESGFTWLGYRFSRLVPTVTLKVRGLRNRYLRPGIGAAVAAHLARQAPVASIAEARRIAAGSLVAASVFLRLEAPRASLRGGGVRGRLELYAEDFTSEVEIEGKLHRLEFDPTAVLAYQLEGSSVWGFEWTGFLRAGIVQSRIPKDRAHDGLGVLGPYSPDKIPVVLVHGTASSPARWAELVNEIEGDPRLRQRYQVWYYRYDTGNPIGYSGGRLRHALESVAHELDPGGTSAALRQMVVIGHSQGGLLSKLCVIDSGNRFWQAISDRPFDSLHFDPATRQTLRDSLFFIPEPFVKRVVFMSTPHRGSYLAGMRIARLTEWLVTLPVIIPVDVLRRTVETVTLNEEAAVLRRLQKPPTSIDNMNPGNPFLKTLADIPVAPGVAINSIIAVEGDGPYVDGNDGVVAYRSAHLDGVESELVVRSSHSVQGQPAAIEEVRRILLRHAGIAGPPDTEQ